MIRRLRWLFVIILVPLVVVGGYQPLLRNLARVRGVQWIVACAGDVYDRETLMYAVWAGVEHPRLDCSRRELEGAGADLVAVAAWLNGVRVASDQLADISPAWRQEVFAWRNSDGANLPAADVGSEAASPALFPAHLAAWSWHNDAQERAMQLARSALAARPSEQVAEVLIRGFGGPRTGDEAAMITQLRQQIAMALPEYIFNYADWFETMAAVQEWRSAELACQGLRQHVQVPSTGSGQTPYEGTAATCRARLAYYRGDYAAAYAELLPMAASLPQDVAVLTWLGLSAKQLGRYAEAEELLREALRYQRNRNAWATLYWNLGDCQRALGKMAEARQSYQAAIRYAPDADSRHYHQSLLDQMQW